MELIYLWVEKYRNIKKQGFNFSPLHDFHFEITNEEKDKVLAGQLIDKMPKYKREINSKLYDKFFDDNNKIKVTAVIGANGSGKSSISEIFFSEEVYIAIFKIEESSYIIHHHKDLSVNNLIALSDDKIQFKAITHKDYAQSFHISTDKEEKIGFIYYTDFYDETKELSNNGGRYNLSIKSRISNSLKQETHSFRLEEFFKKVELIDYFQKSSLGFPFDLPDKVYLGLNIAGLERIFPNNKTELKLPKNENNTLKRINPLAIRNKDEFFQEIRYIIYYCLFTHKKIQNLSIQTVSLYEDQLKKLNQILEKQDDIEKGDPIEIGITSLKKYSEEIKENIFVKEDGQFSTIDEVSKVLTTLIELLKDKTIWSQSRKVLTLSFEEALLIKEQLDKISFIVPPISFYWFKNEQDFHFSSGENAILRMLSSFYSKRMTENLPQNLLFFIDEGELGMHPQWQKQYLNILIKNLPKVFNEEDKDPKHIQFILTSHSPFLVSDLPKENIVFLKKGDNNLCEVEPLIEQEKTFGQNIHTLLSDSFFLEDGLMGKFAQSKIQKLINWLVGIEPEDSFTEEQASAIINLIGEDILRLKLSEMLSNKIAS